MSEKRLKGLVHGLLAISAILELIDSTTKRRKFLLGLAAGWHTHAVIYHMFLE